jgi:hypothetical protein
MDATERSGATSALIVTISSPKPLWSPMSGVCAVLVPWRAAGQPGRSLPSSLFESD